MESKIRRTRTSRTCHQGGALLEDLFGSTEYRNHRNSTILCTLGWYNGNVDIETAYLWGRLPEHEHIAVILPHEKGTVRILRGNIYGLPQADRVYTETRDKFILTEFNKGPWSCRKTEYDPCLFCFRRELPKGETYEGKSYRRMLCVIHTDDVDCVAVDKRDMEEFSPHSTKDSR